MFCIWWVQLGVVYYELLKPSETITGDRYRTQLMRLSRALKKKRPQYQERLDKVILQHDNARLHVARPVKTYLETLNPCDAATTLFSRSNPLWNVINWIIIIELRIGRKLLVIILSIRCNQNLTKLKSENYFCSNSQPFFNSLREKWFAAFEIYIRETWATDLI